MKFGDKLRCARIQKGYTQDYVASAIGIAKSTLSGYENGSREPDVFKIKQLMDVLDISSAYLFDDADSSAIDLSDMERSIILSYRSHPDMQPAVRRLLGLDNAVSSDHAPSASAADAAASLHRDPGDPAFREEIVRYAITQMRELEPDAYNRVFHGAPLEDAIARSLAHDPDDIADSDPPSDQNHA